MNDSKRRFPLSEIFLLLSNAVPLAGALFLDWKLLSIIVVYWAESAVVGFYNVLKMMMEKGGQKEFLILFFLFHYGFFMFGHYIAVLIFAIWTGDRSMIDIGLLAPLYTDSSVLAAIAASFVSHGVSFAQNFIGRKEYLATTVDRQMIRPYGRIAMMHVAILASAFTIALTRFDRPVTAVVILIILKTVLDFYSHRRERRKAEAR
jgi:hypothetical protein